MNKILFSCLAVALVSGCASIAVNDDALQSRTASALGLQPSEFVISNRSDSGVRTDYNVKAKNKTYACYVTGSVSIVGRSVSDAICTPTGATQAQPAQAAQPAPACNALLKAAKKC
jgi:nucleoid-associated protein YejK